MVDSAKSMTGGGGPMQPGMDQSMVTAGPGSYNPNQEAFQPQAPVGGLVNEQSEPINGGVAQVQPVQPIQTPNAPVPQDPQTDCKFKIATSELAPFSVKYVSQNITKSQYRIDILIHMWYTQGSQYLLLSDLRRDCSPSRIKRNQNEPKLE